jgi:hypothetical protein
MSKVTLPFRRISRVGSAAIMFPSCYFCKYVIVREYRESLINRRWWYFHAAAVVATLLGGCLKYHPMPVGAALPIALIILPELLVLLGLDQNILQSPRSDPNRS